MLSQSPAVSSSRQGIPVAWSRVDTLTRAGVSARRDEQEDRHETAAWERHSGRKQICFNPLHHASEHLQIVSGHRTGLENFQSF